MAGVSDQINNLNLYASKIRQRVKDYESRGESPDKVVDDLETYVRSMSFIIKILKKSKKH